MEEEIKELLDILNRIFPHLKFSAVLLALPPTLPGDQEETTGKVIGEYDLANDISMKQRMGSV